MSRPSFKMPTRPEPAAAKLDEWVAGSEVQAAPPAELRAERPTGKMARLTIDLPADLHARFKAACAIKGTKMINEVTRFIEEWTQKNV